MRSRAGVAVRGANRAGARREGGDAPDGWVLRGRRASVRAGVPLVWASWWCRWPPRLLCPLPTLGGVKRA